MTGPEHQTTMSAMEQRLHEFWPDGFDAGDVAGLCEDAAAEIKRLREALADRRRGLVFIEDDGTIRTASWRDT